MKKKKEQGRRKKKEQGRGKKEKQKKNQTPQLTVMHHHITFGCKWPSGSEDVLDKVLTHGQKDKQRWTLSFQYTLPHTHTLHYKGYKKSHGHRLCSELRSCMKVKVAVLGSPSLTVFMVSVDVK